MRADFGFSCKVIERCSGILVHIAMWSVFVMMVLVVVDVALRTFAGSSLLFAEEVSGYLLVSIAYLAVAEALKQGRHVRVELLTRWLPPRLQARLELILTLAALGAIIVVSWRSVIMVYRSYIRGVRIPGILMTPVYLPQIFMVIGLLALGLQLTVEINKMVRARRGLPKTAPTEKGIEETGV